MACFFFLPFCSKRSCSDKQLSTILAVVFNTVFRKAKLTVEVNTKKNHTFCWVLPGMVFIFALSHSPAFHHLDHFTVNEEGCCISPAPLAKATRSQWAWTQRSFCHFHSSIPLQHYSCRFKKRCDDCDCHMWKAYSTFLKSSSMNFLHENHLNKFSISITSRVTLIKMPQISSISLAWKTSASIIHLKPQNFNVWRKLAFSSNIRLKWCLTEQFKSASFN